MKRKLLSVILALAMLCSLMLVPAAAAEPDGGNWYDGAMSTWADRGVLQGDAGGNLNPTANITRAELAVILDRIMGYQVKGSNTFADVQDGAWYADAVLKASTAGVLQGDGANARPSATITRQEAMVMLARVMKLSGEAGASAGFADQDRVVLLAAREDLHDAFHLPLASYDGIDAASASFVRKVGAEFVQQGRFRRRSVPDRFAQADEP